MPPAGAATDIASAGALPHAARHDNCGDLVSSIGNPSYGSSSPELMLVDPELARRARELLRDPETIGKGNMSLLGTHEITSGIGLGLEPPLSPPVVGSGPLLPEPSFQPDFRTVAPALRPPKAPAPEAAPVPAPAAEPIPAFEPLMSSQPVEPAQPAEPVQPVEALQPVEPVQPAEIPALEPLMAPVAPAPVIPQADPLPTMAPEPQPEIPAMAPEPAPVEPAPLEPTPIIPVNFPPAPDPEPTQPEPTEPEPAQLPVLEPLILTPPAPEPVTPPAAEVPDEAPAELPVIDPFPPAPAAEPVAPAPYETQLLEPLVHSRGAYRVIVRLQDGDGVDVGEFNDFGTAMEGAQEVIEQFSNSNGSWPFYAGRFIRPDLIVSVDVVDA